MPSTFNWLLPQVLTFAIPLGTLGLVVLVGFFWRNPSQR
jgi:hypothetical protein